MLQKATTDPTLPNVLPETDEQESGPKLKKAGTEPTLSKLGVSTSVSAPQPKINNTSSSNMNNGKKQPKSPGTLRSRISTAFNRPGASSKGTSGSKETERDGYWDVSSSEEDYYDNDKKDALPLRSTQQQQGENVIDLDETNHVQKNEKRSKSPSIVSNSIEVLQDGEGDIELDMLPVGTTV
eukprot:Pgem_evm1s11998